MGDINKKQDQPQGQRNGSLKNGNPPCDLALLPRCNAMAKTTGVRCKQAAMKNGKCYWHGGASTGAPLGNMNSFKHSAPLSFDRWEGFWSGVDNKFFGVSH